VRYALYGLVGLCGVAVHLTILAILYRVEGVSLVQAQTTATVAAIVCNFYLNNAITYSDRKIRGIKKLVLGLLIYGAGCSVGAMANLGLTNLLARSGVPGLLAGSVGMLVSSVWNYAIASVFTWGVWRRRAKDRKATGSAVVC
jgi:dolichol-phosphate mannosyltransferase